MKRMLRAFLLLSVFLCFPLTAQARKNETQYPSRTGYYYIEVHWKGSLFSRYRVSHAIGADRGLPDGSSWVDASMTKLSGTSSLALAGKSYTTLDGLPDGFYIWNRQYVMNDTYDLTYEFLGYHVGRIVEGQVANNEQVLWFEQTSPSQFHMRLDTNGNGMTNWATDGQFHHVTAQVFLEPNAYPLRFHPENPNGVDDVVLGRTSQTVSYDTAWGELPVPQKKGYTFLGWYTEPQGGTPITGDMLCQGRAIVDGGGEDAYAHWRPNTYLVRFHPNGDHDPGTVTGSMDAIQVSYDQTEPLPVNQYAKCTSIPAEDEGAPNIQKDSVFQGWGMDVASLSAAYGDGADVRNLSDTDGAVIDLYAIWDDAPKFVLASYPDRYFTLEEAKSGAITEAELLRTVEVYDREDTLLPVRPEGGEGPGVFLVNYDPSDFTGLTDDGSVSVRYLVRDREGSFAYLNVSAHISRNGHFDAPMVSRYRSISEPYAEETESGGGLAPRSRWRGDHTYASALASSFSGTPAYDLRLTKTDLSAIRAFVGTNGFGNSERADALWSLWEQVQ